MTDFVHSQSLDQQQPPTDPIHALRPIQPEPEKEGPEQLLAHPKAIILLEPHGTKGGVGAPYQGQGHGQFPSRMQQQRQQTAPYECPRLPYAYDALVSHGLSADQLLVHHDKHHAGYVAKLNSLVSGKRELEGLTLEDLVRRQSGSVFNNAAQAWNHAFYWHSLSPTGGGEPTGRLGELVAQRWGSFDKLKAEFTERASHAFGSNWVWLVYSGASGGQLDVISTHDAGCPLTSTGQAPLLACDVWEHAYYVDYLHNRGKYVEHWWKLANWEFATENLLAALAECDCPAGAAAADAAVSPTEVKPELF